MKQKAFVLIVSLAMLVKICVPGTLAVEAAGQCVCEKIEHTHTTECYTKSETPSCGLEPGAGAHIHSESCYEQRKELTCTLVEDEMHAHGESCYTTQVVCICGQEEVEGHQHDDNCYSQELTCTLEEHQHSDGCYLSQSNEPSLYERLMACETLLELYTLAEATPEEELLALTNEENAQIEAKIEALQPAPLPPIGDNTADVLVDEPVMSEIIYPTVNFDNVAPFGAPVEG